MADIISAVARLAWLAAASGPLVKSVRAGSQIWSTPMTGLAPGTGLSGLAGHNHRLGFTVHKPGLSGAVLNLRCAYRAGPAERCPVP